MYRIIVHCELGESASLKSDDAIGFFNVKFESGSERSAMTNAIARSKNLMIQQGYTLDDVMGSQFSIDEWEVIDEKGKEEGDIESSLIFY